MKITLDQKVAGDWAKVGQDIKDGDRIKLMDAGQVSEGKFGEQYIFKIMTTKKAEFNLALNRTSRNTLGRGFGVETEEWVGKVAKAFVVRQMIGDGLKNVLYLAPDGWVMTDDGEFLSPDDTANETRSTTKQSELADDIGDNIPF